MEKDTANNASLEGSRRTPAIAMVALTIGVPGALLWSWSRPIEASPRELPPLVLDSTAIASCRAQHRSEAEHTARDGLASERRSLYLESNSAELAAEGPDRADERHDALVRAANALAAAHGQTAIASARASDLARLEPALRGTVSRSESRAELGSFPAMLERYGAVSQGEQLAPTAVVHAFFAARWNAMHERPLTEGLCPVERVAYFGWLAIGATELPVGQRVAALDEYTRGGGRFAQEIRGILLTQQGDPDGAREAFAQAYEQEPIFRLRNYSLPR
jgi:hypothetical protein